LDEVEDDAAVVVVGIVDVMIGPDLRSELIDRQNRNNDAQKKSTSIATRGGLMVTRDIPLLFFSSSFFFLLLLLLLALRCLVYSTRIKSNVKAQRYSSTSFADR
jgi:hypothetical protein